MSRSRETLVVALQIVLTIALAATADYRESSKAIKVSGGEDHTLVLTADKGVWACGPNGGYAFWEYYYGVLGTGSEYWNLTQKTLVRVEEGDMNTPSDYLENIDAIVAGWMHSLALDVNGSIWSWGWNSEGQLGIGLSGPEAYSTTPVQVLRGEQADDPGEPSGYLKHITGISAGRSGRHSLAVDADAYAFGWGYNKYGQCGNDESNNSKLTPVRVHRGEQPEDLNDPNNWLKHIIDICAGADQSIALEKDDPGDPNFSGCVYTWGTNRWGDDTWDVGIVSLGCGLLGTASDVNLSATPVKVLAGAQHANDPNQHLKHIVAVAAGWDHCMALEKDDPYDPNIYNPAYTGRVFTWGNNGPGWGGGDPCNLPEEVSVGGRLGNGTYTDSNVPVLVLAGEQYPPDPNSPLEHIIAISAGEGHSMALDVNGYVYCWGDNQYGQLGNGRNEPCSAPVRVIAGMQNSEDPNLPLSNIVAISAGHWHSLAIDSDGVVWVWGKTKDGRLGLANMANAYPCYSSIPHRIPVVYNQTQETFAFGIEAAVTGADDGDLLMASAGTYYENVEVFDTNITLESMDPNNGDVVADTIIDAHYNNAYSYTVDFDNGSDCTFAGFTLTNGTYAALYCGGSSSVNITGCRIENNAGNGIACNQSSAAITDSTVQDNADYGVEATGDCNVTIERSLIEGNGKSGVYAHDGCDFVLKGSVVRDNGWDGVDLEDNSSETLTNNWIHNNGTAGESYGCGIWFENYRSATPFVRNNTICGNPTYGIEVGVPEFTDPNWTDPNILNCIIYGNAGSDLHRASGSFNNVNYSCLQNAHAGTGNITGDPCFVDADANDFHLASNSPCIDAGDPGFEPEPNETDIDGNVRVIGEEVDIGADEFWATDFSRDGLVNFVDYAMLAAAWHTEPNDANYNDDFDLADNNAIDFGDILAFCHHWLSNAELWTGPMPLMAGRGGAGMVEGSGLDAGLSAVAVAEREPAIAEPVDIEAIMKWLAEIWLDPDVQKSIDEEKFLKVYESLKGL